METWKTGGWILICLIMCCPFCNRVSAQSLVVTDLSVTPSEIWLNKNPNVLTISAKCEFGGSIINNADMWAHISFPNGGGMDTPLYTTGFYEYIFKTSFPESGTYTVKMSCEHGGYTASATRSFTAHRLDLSMDYGKELDTYLGDDLTLDVKFMLDADPITPKKDTFSVYMGSDDRWEPLEQTEDPILVGGRQQVKVKIPLYSDRIRNGLYDLRIESRYSDDERLTLEKRKFVWVNDPLAVYLKEDEIVHVIGSLAEINLSASVVFKAGDLWDLDIENTEVNVHNLDTSKKVPVRRVYCSRDVEECVFSLSLPALAPGEYNLELTLAYPTTGNYRYKATASLPLREVLKISGNVRDARDKAVDTTIVVESINRGEIEEVRTSAAGNYSLSLLPGDYNFIFRFSGGTIIRVSNVSISNSDLISLPGDLIRYDQGHINSDMPDGMRLLKIMVLELAFPFSDLWVYVNYDSSKVTGDEKRLKVYICDRWNFERSLCTGRWDEIGDVAVHTIKDALEFNTSFYGAFMVGESDKLSFSGLKVIDDEVYMSDPVTIEGIVLNSKKEPVHGVTINASFPGHPESATTKTNIEGEFKISVNAPKREGDVELEVRAEKDLFVGTNTTQMISVDRKRELSILGVPDIIDISLDDVTDMELSLFNSGQMNLEDPIYLHVIGISSDWYELLPNYADGLEINEEKPFILRIKLTPELCGGTCNKFYLVNLEAKSRDISSVASFTIRLPSTSFNETEDSGEEQQEDEPAKPGITGFSVSMPSISSPYLSLTVIVILLFLIVNKRKTAQGPKSFGKRSKRGHALRNSIMSSFHRIRKDI